MRRREYLGVVTAATATAVAGCSSIMGRPTKSLGETATHKGVSVTVHEYTVADAVETRAANQIYEEDKGLLVRISAENTADEPRPLPRQSTNTIYGESNGDRVGNVLTNSTLGVEGQNYTSYNLAAETGLPSDGPAEPGTSIEGWALFAVPGDFTPADIAIVVEIGPTDASKTFEWSLAESN